MKPIADMTDICLEEMKPNEIFSFEDWWQDVLKLSELPHKKTYDYMKWATCTRGKVVQRINKELVCRKKAQRLVCVGNGRGLYLVDSEHITSYSIDKRVRRVVLNQENTMREWNELIESPDLSTADTRMLKAAVGWIEVNQSMTIGTLLKLPLLKGTKNTLMKNLGINPNPKKKRKKVNPQSDKNPRGV